MGNYSSDLTYHHTGCLVKNLEESMQHYKTLLPGAFFSPIYHIESQKVKLVFLQLSEHVFLELIECTEGNISLSKLVKKNMNFYHIAFTTNQAPIDTVISKLEKRGFLLISKFSSEAFEGKPCAFLFSPEMHMIEIIET